MLTLGIETSCDETSVAVLKNETELISHIIASQDVHLKYGGVVPELASRAHIKTILPVLDEALGRAGKNLPDIDLIGVTAGPGLIGSLLIGVSVAKSISYSHSIPLVGIHHIEAHIMANFLEHPEISPPFLTLVVSGGHTMLIKTEDWGKHKILGRTRDDAAGEAFDKVAKLLELPYPGGPSIEKTALDGDEKFFPFPRPMMKEDNLDFSFSGLKTAVVNYVHKKGREYVKENVADVCASFQAAVIEVLAEKTFRLVKQDGIKTVLLAGGVACNKPLRKAMAQKAKKSGCDFFYPSPIFCTDNGAMIARTALMRYKLGNSAGLDLNPDANLPFPEN